MIVISFLAFCVAVACSRVQNGPESDSWQTAPLVIMAVEFGLAYGSVLWPHTALLLHLAIFVWSFQDGFTSAQFTFYILHISFQFSIFLFRIFLSSIFFTFQVLQDFKNGCVKLHRILE